MPEFIVFGSAGGVRAFLRSGITPDPKIKHICIGPVCADAFHESTGLEAIRSESITAASIAETIRNMIQ